MDNEKFLTGRAVELSNGVNFSSGYCSSLLHVEGYMMTNVEVKPGVFARDEAAGLQTGCSVFEVPPR